MFSPLSPICATWETYTTGYNRNVSGDTVRKGAISKGERLTIQGRSEVLHLLQIFGADLSVKAKCSQHLVSKPSKNIWVGSKQ